MTKDANFHSSVVIGDVQTWKAAVNMILLFSTVNRLTVLL